MGGDRGNNNNKYLKRVLGGLKKRRDRTRVLALNSPRERYVFLCKLYYDAAFVERVAAQAEEGAKNLGDEYTCVLFTCPKCKQRKSKYFQKQVRRADEAATNFVTCICKHRFRC